ncbi:hypothetical protein GCM10007377_13890 [Galliscardovia ingluviei]|uniref:Lipid II flippase MurJ n=2 Tax=Galliscardovia ingluviei TaxID=1769422 RepID=A0A8J3ARS7_9BIFI|nr:murein biosynthesis integral membrane protein MurJ [Galliscardovia ingluviei]GGI15033.1 hypothetical protein GCM10007377_13890 [Galliscardovia ingluviei]
MSTISTHESADKLVDMPTQVSSSARLEESPETPTMHPQHANTSVRKNSLIMAVGTAASRVTGQIRSILLAAAIGTTGIAANAYQTGSTIPQVIFTLISGGIFNAVLVPQIVRTLQHHDAKDRLNKLITLAMALLIGITATMMFLTPLITRLYVNPNWDSQQRALVNAFTLWCMPQIFFYGVYLVLGQILAATGRFGMYAWSSVFANVISCAGFTVFIVLFGNASRRPLDFWNAQTLALTAGSWTLGVAVQALVLFIPLMKIGLHYRIRWGLRGLGLRSMGRVAAWSLAITAIDLVIGMITSQINTGAPHAAGDLYNVAGNGSYQYAYSLFILPYSLIAVSITTAAFPKLAQSISKHRIDQAQHDLFSSLRLVVLCMVFFSAALIVMPLPIIRALLPSVNLHDAALISGPLIGLSVALLPASVFLLAQRTFYAFEDGRSTFLVALVQVSVQCVLMLLSVVIMPPQWWASAVGWSIALSNAAAMPYLFIRLRRRMPHMHHDALTLARTLLYSLLAGCIAAGVCWIVLHELMAIWHISASAAGVMSWVQAVVICIIGSVVMIVLYGGILHLCKVPEVRTLLTMVKQKLLRR